MTKQAIDALQAERELVIQLAESLTPEEWATPSDCVGWRVQDVVAHMSAVFKTVAGAPVARAEPASDDAERNADSGVDERRSWSSDEVLDEYREWSATAIAALTTMQEPPLADAVIPLGNLGDHPMHILADALVFDHYCHLRHDLLAPAGPLQRDALPQDDLRLTPAIEWMLAGLPQMCASALEVDRPLSLVLEGAGGGSWIIAPGERLVTITSATADDAAATVTSSAHDFVSWGTKRRGWRDLGVRVDGDVDYGASVLDAINII